MRERGSATVVMMAVAALLITVSMGVMGLAGAMVASARASAAADAAALAAAVATHPATARGAPDREAGRIAAANGATLMWCDCRVNASMEVRQVTVAAAVEFDAPIFGPLRVVKEARAEFDPVAWLGR